MKVEEDVSSQLETFNVPTFGRLRATGTVTNDRHFGPDARVPARTFWIDTTLNTSCMFQLMPDGKARCLPTPAATVYFTDNTCKTPAALTAVDMTVPCVTFPDRAATSWNTSTCPATISFVQVGSSFVQGSPVFQLANGTCRGVRASMTASTATPISADMLVTATITME